MRRSQVPRKVSQDCGAHTAQWNPRRTRLSPTLLQQPALEARGVRAGPGAKHLCPLSREALRGSNNPGWGKSADKGGDSEDDTGPGSPPRAGGSVPWLRAVLSSSSKAAGRPGVGTTVPTSQQRGAAGERCFPGSPGDRTGPESPSPPISLSLVCPQTCRLGARGQDHGPPPQPPPIPDPRGGEGGTPAPSSGGRTEPVPALGPGDSTGAATGTRPPQACAGGLGEERVVSVSAGGCEYGCEHTPVGVRCSHR